jgi:N-acetylglucosamine kinase-like BadF-type ATPase
MRYVLGVDGGASKTHALVVNEMGCVLGFGQGGSSNYQVDGLSTSMHSIEHAVRCALDRAGLSPSELSVGYFCLAGADLPEDFIILQEAVQALNLVQSVVIKNDTMAALRSGTTRSWGVVVICGTGFNAAGVSPEGKEIIFPALGPISGDWGGGQSLSEEMIRAVMRAWDGRGIQTLLTQLVLGALSVSSTEELLSMLYHEQIDPQRLLDLVPLLFDAAEQGDQVSQELIVRMGTEVAVSANAIIRRLSMTKEDFEVVLGGSVFKGRGDLLLNTIDRLVHEVAPKARIARPHREPVVGAALFALEAIGVVIHEDLYQVVDDSMRSVRQIGITNLMEEHSG